MNPLNSAFCARCAAVLVSAFTLTLAGCPNCAPYVALINPDHFGGPIDNLYYPLSPGTTFTYEKVTGEGIERAVVTVSREKKTILDVECTVVRDTVTQDGELVEDTFDWFAQDMAGNVWYFGEYSTDFEDGAVAGHDGSWEAGVNGAQPGVVMKANRRVGDTYYQEFSCDIAEDQATIVGLEAAVVVPYGLFSNCVQTTDFTPLEPGVEETKFYAPGVGFVLAEEADGNLQLVSVSTQ